MKIAIHITHYHVEGRTEYLRQVLTNLSAIPHDLDVYIYSNIDPHIVDEFKTLRVRSRKFQFRNFYGSRRFLSLIKTFSHMSFVSVAQRVHPFYLTWANRKFVEQMLDQYDVQVYMEDDLGITDKTIEYWQRYSPGCIASGYNLGFLLVEEDVENDRLLCPSLLEQPTSIIYLYGKPYLLNDVNPYCAFWIYDRDELKMFTKSKEWDFKFKGYGVRERAAIGWHGIEMKRYKGTLLPLLEMGDGSLSVDPDCTVRHFPNNYVGHDYFGKVEFPITVAREH